jgi:hypothetical protein
MTASLIIGAILISSTDPGASAPEADLADQPDVVALLVRIPAGLRMFALRKKLDLA